MKIYDETKTNELSEYDLSKGYIIPSKRFVAHHEAVEADEGEFHYKIIAEYPNGGKDVEIVYDREPVAAAPAYDEYEDIGVYIKYNDDELASIEIEDLKRKLLETDYIVCKLYEAGLKDSSSLEELKKEYAEKLACRAEWRSRINSLETKLSDSKNGKI